MYHREYRGIEKYKEDTEATGACICSVSSLYYPLILCALRDKWAVESAAL